MKIQSLFAKPITRPINGVIKADQKDAFSIWQELDEYVVTPQLKDHLGNFFSAYLSGMDNPNDVVLNSRMGVWISGFFGSGKSHFLKILSYLLENRVAEHPETGMQKLAVDFFDEHKINDPLMVNEIARAVRGKSTDVILFNIDAKADSRSDRDVMLQVFMRVFNERLGFCADNPHIADMERYLTSKGRYGVFKSAFERLNGSAWEAERDAVDFHRDVVIEALSEALEMTLESAAKWFDNARDSFRLNIEGFAAIINDYLATKPKGHRVIFLVDEIGQFIADNTNLMLNLQTITEELGSKCGGGAWVIVTSQADMDAAIGENNKAKSQDFSKIQGRFHTRLSLSSANVDEVIATRLLSKTDEANHHLHQLFEHKGDIINNQIIFINNSYALSTYRDSMTFAKNYPFIPYQFQLVQKIFESIRNVGATGQHLSRGERSLLEAFQLAAKQQLDADTNVLVPLNRFYPAIESFIDNLAKRSIQEAPNNPVLQHPFDTELLKLLFLIRYIPEIIVPNIDNLATLSLTHIDQDKLQLKRDIQESLARLESQSLISRNGDLWYFLTNEEQDLSRRINNLPIASQERMKTVAELLFEEVLQSKARIRHADTKGDYDINRLLDGTPYKNANHALTLEVITPFHDDYELLQTGRLIGKSSEGHGSLIVRLSEGERFDRELDTYLRIEQFMLLPQADAASPSEKKVIAQYKDQNRERRSRLVSELAQMFVNAETIALGQVCQLKATNPVSRLEEAVNYLITNTYIKLAMLKHRQADVITELKAVLSADSLAQSSLALTGDQANPSALQEVRQYLQYKSEQVLLSDVIDKFTDIPYGWKPDWEIVLMVAKLFMAGEIALREGQNDLTPQTAFEVLNKSAKHRLVAILKRKRTDATQLMQVGKLYQTLFAQLPPTEEDAQVAAWRERLQQWQSQAEIMQRTAMKSDYPGEQDLTSLVQRLKRQLAINDAFAFLEKLLSDKNDWQDAHEDWQDIEGFYKTQVSQWQAMLDTLNACKDNEQDLLQDASVKTAWSVLNSIKTNARPYGQVAQIAAAVSKLSTANDQLATQARSRHQAMLDQRIDQLEAEMNGLQAPADVKNKALLPLQNLKKSLDGMNSLPKMHYAMSRVEDLVDQAHEIVQSWIASLAPKPTVVSTGGQTAPTLPPAPISKPIAAVKVSDFVTGYIDSPESVETFIAQLKAEMLAQVKQGKRVRLQH